MVLSSPVTSISGIGEALSQKLERLGVSTVFDLLYHLPFRFEDRRHISPASQVQTGETVTVQGTISSIKNEFTRSGKFIQKATLADANGTLEVIWFNQMFLVKSLKNRTVSLSGKVDFFGRQKTLISPEYELISGQKAELIHTGRLVPVYPETAGISSKLLRTKLFKLIQELDVDDFLTDTYGQISWKNALRQSHFPVKPEDVSLGRSRLAFDELFLLKLNSLIHKQKWNKTRLSHPLKVKTDEVSAFIGSLPFSLTFSQKTAIEEIISDLAKNQPMNRLLKGDVGSGKTVVAAIAAFVTHKNGFQTVLMAPTQILALQHFQTISDLTKSFDIPVSLITSSAKSISSVKAGVIIGTHALISEKNRPLLKEAGLIVIDEQHRFGVAQRELAGKLGQTPHILTMTATPIPRTVALTMFGDLAESVLSEKPIGRLSIKTWVVPESKRESSYQWIQNEVTSTGHQVIWVCPFINESDNSASVKAAVNEYDRLQKVFPHLSLGLMHGKLNAKGKNQVISDFRSGKINILVATPVVEVGLDIPNASIMIIEGSERFGLAQLHQLRGRVGRSSHQSYCLLFTTDGNSTERLRSMETHHSGQELAEIDLRLRGPGDIYGIEQHGFPQFKVATYENLELIELAQKAAIEVFPKLPELHLLRDLLKEDKIAFTRPN
jgi:ATP-dependent DNA helicase RecG